MNKSECLSVYQNELWRQENPYQQWIRKNEIESSEEIDEAKKELVQVTRMNEFTSEFHLDFVQEKYLLVIGNEGMLSLRAAATIAEYFESHGDVDIIYADEDYLDVTTNERSNPWFKPEYAPDSFLSSFYFGNIFAIRVDKFKNINPTCGQDYSITIYDFMLNAVEQAGAIHHIPRVLFHRTVPFTAENVMWATEEFDNIKLNACNRRNMQVRLAKEEKTALNDNENEGYASKERKRLEIKHICYDIKEQPLISVIIPSKDHFDILKTCISSFLKYTRYSNVEFIVVDNGSCEEEKEKILQFLKETFDANETHNCYYDYEIQPFNFSKMCNRGAERAEGEYLLFLNDDIEIISTEWLDRMLGQAMLPHVGAVGCKLLYPEERRIQHVGITNMGIGPAHKLNGFVDDRIYAYGENCLVLNKLAVTAACLLVSKEKFKIAGGFPSDMAVAYNDVALCFSLLKHGFLNVVRNDVTLIHHESLSRGMDDTNEKKKRLQREKKLLYTRYPKWDGRDSYYSKDWVQLRKDTDYTCNYIYEHEDETVYNKITRVMQEQKKKLTKEKSSNKIVRKLLKQDALSFSIDSIQERTSVTHEGKQCFYYTAYDKEEADYLQINGWSIIQKENNERYEYRYLLRNEDDTIYECRTFSQVRRDVEQIFAETGAKNIALAGKVARVPNDIITPGVYKIGVAAKSLIDQKYDYVTWSEDYLLFFLKK